jgi:uncharacterized protein (TIGR02001 family)
MGFMTRRYDWLWSLSYVATLTIAVFWSESAGAREDQIKPKVPAPPPPAQKLQMGLGVTGTTDYIARGISQDDGHPAIQGYVEPRYRLGPILGDAFVKIWSSNVDFGAEGAEIDVAAGIKPKFLGPRWSPSIGYVHYFYAPERVSPDYGEIYAQTDYAFGENARYTLRALIFFAPNFSQTATTGTWIAGGGKVAISENLAAYAGVGHQFFGESNTLEQLAWTAGLSYYWKSLTFDVQYWDTDLSDVACIVRSGFADGCEARVVGTISLDTTWSAFTRGSY